jgi:hypothetical protein
MRAREHSCRLARRYLDGVRLLDLPVERIPRLPFARLLECVENSIIDPYAPLRPCYHWVDA